MFASSFTPLVYGSLPFVEVCTRVVTPKGVRHMATLKDIKLRIKSVTSISKLTKTMQMVASSKLRAATKKVEDTKLSATTINKIFSEKEIPFTSEGTALLVAITSDKGMCGPINNQIIRHTKNTLRTEKDSTKFDFVALGNKGVPSMLNEFPKQVTMSMKDFGRREYTFLETGFVVDQLLSTKNYESVSVIYNKFKNALTYIITEVPIRGPATLLANKTKFARYEFDEDEDATFRDLFEYQLAMTIWNGLMENRASELAARMTSMDNATKNAASLISLLQVQYNRGRQAAITTELIEITSGASAISDMT